jgi:hypothetical protein
MSKEALKPGRSFLVLDGLVSPDKISTISRDYMSAIKGTDLDNEWQDLQGRKWKLTRNYILDGKITEYAQKLDLGAHFEPLLHKAQREASQATGEKLVPEQVFATLYDSSTVEDNGSHFYEHRDYDNQGRLLFCSVIIQGHTPDGMDDDGFYGRLDCREPDTMEESTVSLRAGDALFLNQTWHCPHAIEQGCRLVFIFFFHRADRPGGSVVKSFSVSKELDEDQQDNDDWSNYLIFNIGSKELEDELGEDTFYSPKERYGQTWIWNDEWGSGDPGLH